MSGRAIQAAKALIYWLAVLVVGAVFGLGLGKILAALWLFLMPAAFAHDAPAGWSYPLSCCSGYDCRPVRGASVKEGADGYTVPSGEIVRYRDARVRDSPDGEFHWCTIGGKDDGRTICIFVPPRAY
ncbi:hypothetical protein [Ensifer soli]|uniref:hypothetical protein n=1 Tax=Ciceribacter sp. sgz301302 TaxID=3342379 RepID=UPI0035B78149